MEPLKIEQKHELEKQIINALAVVTWAMKTGCRETAQERILELEKYIHGLPVLFCEHLIYCGTLRRPNGETGPGLVCLLKSMECPRNAETAGECDKKPRQRDCEDGSCKL